MAAGVGRRMQDLLHGVMGLIGMGHLQVREGDRKPEEGGGYRGRDGESVKGWGEGRGAWEEREEKRNEFQRE